MGLRDYCLRRTEREKESGGLPDLPVSGRLVELEYAVIEDRKVRAQLRNVSAIEQQVRAYTKRCIRWRIWQALAVCWGEGPVTSPSEER